MLDLKNQQLGQRLRIPAQELFRGHRVQHPPPLLGMLGLLTLGKLIALSKGFFWDQMFFYVLLGGSVIVIGDLFSMALRRWLR